MFNLSVYPQFSSKKSGPRPELDLIPVCTTGRVLCDITRFSPRIDQIFPGEAFNPFFGAQDEEFLEFRSR